MKHIVFRTMGGKGIGYGHFYRCLSLAKAFKTTFNHLRIIFLINKDLKEQLLDSEFEYLINDKFIEDFNIVRNLKTQLFILDSYLANNDYLIKMRELSRIMIFDDNNDVFDSTIPDILLNGNIHAKHLDYKTNHNSLYLLGTQYLVMRKEYWEEEIIEYEKKEGILITTGGTDTFSVSLSILEDIKELPYRKRVIIGPGYDQSLIKKLEGIKDENIDLIYKPQSLKEYISKSKVAITAGGSTVYEVLSQKTIPIIFSIADNQDIACKQFQRQGILYLGKYPYIKHNIINEELVLLMKENASHNSSIFSLVDGLGAKRVVESIYCFINSCGS